jgi:predicted nucleic acid-binding protein
VSGWLLDTNVVSELRRPRPEPRVLAFVAAQALDSLYLSEVSLAEIRYGIERVDDALKRRELVEWLDGRVRPLFHLRTLTVSEDVLLRWRLLVEQARRQGHTYAQPDLFLAATALHHGLTLVTRNTADFTRSGVPLLDPWASSSAS